MGQRTVSWHCCAEHKFILKYKFHPSTPSLLSMTHQLYFLESCGGFDISSLHTLRDSIGAYSRGIHESQTLPKIPSQKDDRDWVENLCNSFSQPSNGEITLFSRQAFPLSPVVFDDCKLAVEFWKENTKMSILLNFFNNPLFLLQEI